MVNFLKESFHLWIEVSFYLLLGMFIAGLLHVFLGKSFISKQLGKPGFLSIVKATILGVPLPVCSCGVIPLASSLEKDGASKSSVLSFLVSTPTTGVDSILATYSLLGPLFAIFRPLAAIVAGIVLGLSHYLWEGRKDTPNYIPQHTHLKTTFNFKIKEVFRYGFYEVAQDIGRWLLLGTLLGGFISAVLPKEFFSSYAPFPWDFLVALLIGLPLYVCATGSIPIAVSLISKGFSPGAGLVFLIAGPATNTITLSFIWAKFKRGSFYLYLISIVLTALILGLIFNYLWVFLGKNPQLLKPGGEVIPHQIKAISGILLFLVVVNSLIKRKEEVTQPDFKIDVPDIHCQSCKLTLEGRLKMFPGVEKVSVDVGKKRLEIKGKVKREDVIQAIKEAGYHPREES